MYSGEATAGEARLEFPRQHDPLALLDVREEQHRRLHSDRHAYHLDTSRGAYLLLLRPASVRRAQAAVQRLPRKGAGRRDR